MRGWSRVARCLAHDHGRRLRAAAHHALARLEQLANDDDARARLVELLEGSGVFDDLSWPDARDVADALSADAGRPDGPETMRHRAQTVAVGRETWDDRTAVVWALTLAADVLDALEAT